MDSRIGSSTVIRRTAEPDREGLHGHWRPPDRVLVTYRLYLVLASMGSASRMVLWPSGKRTMLRSSQQDLQRPPAGTSH